VSTVLLSGASGFIGSHLERSLNADGHRVVHLARVSAQSNPSASQDAVTWDPERGTIDRQALEQVAPDAVVNLAGEPIAQRWSDAKRRQIRDSRVNGTRALSRALAELGNRPRVLVSGSAVGYYGAHRGDEMLTEDSPPGDDFLAGTARAWEDATRPAADGGIRVAISRTGLVVGTDGGVLAKMLTPFRIGVGGRMGRGRQWMSWIALDDMVRALRFLIDTATARGAFNLVAPEPVTNSQFTKALAEALHRPAFLPVPSFALELAFGTMAGDTILASQRAIPKRLAGAGFEFRYPRLQDALRFELSN
jgi:uncharacterized protein